MGSSAPANDPETGTPTPLPGDGRERQEAPALPPPPPEKSPRAAPFDPEATVVAGGTDGNWVVVEKQGDSEEPISIEEFEIEELDIEEVDFEEIVIDELIGTPLGRYRLLDLLGEGGMGKVYLAEHVKIGRKVAIKLLRSQYASRPDIVTRFFQEARAVNQIRHEHIIDITDFVEDSEGHSYLVMELLTGRDLGDLIRKHWPIPLMRTLEIFIQIADALAAAHDVGIVHRDLKPDNVFLMEKGEQTDYVKIVDFGVAKLLGDAIGGDYGAGMVIGTPAYMSPEQANGSMDIDARADIYAFGAMLYRVCVGRPPFRGKTIAEYARKHLSEPPPPPNDVPGIPELIPAGLEKIILECLAKDPDDRYQTAYEVAAELRDVLQALLPDEIELVHVPAALPTQAGRGRTGLIALIAAALLGVAGTAVFLVRSGHPEDAAASSKMATVAKVPETREPVEDDSPARVEFLEARIRFFSRPLGAEVIRADDPESEPLGITPFAKAFERENHEVEFTFRLPGYEPTTGKVLLAEDGRIDVALAKTVATARPRKRPRPVPATAAPKPKKKKKKKRFDVHDRVDPFGD